MATETWDKSYKDQAAFDADRARLEADGWTVRSVVNPYEVMMADAPSGETWAESRSKDASYNDRTGAVGALGTWQSIGRWLKRRSVEQQADQLEPARIEVVYERDRQAPARPG